MKYRSLYIALFLLGGTTHIFACEPEKEKAQERIVMYECLFNKNIQYPMAKFIRLFFKGVYIEDQDNEERCDFYWHPNQPMDMKTARKCEIGGWVHLWMRHYKKGYEIYFKELHEEYIQEKTHKDQEIAIEAKVKLNLYPENHEDILEILPVLDVKDTSQSES